MTPDRLPVVPSPPAHRWRQFRLNVLPYLTFGLVLMTVVWLWGRNLANPLLTGQAEGLEADVASPRPGRIAQLKVVLYQEVKAGDIIAVVDAADPLILSNTVRLAQAEMNAIRVDRGYRPTDKVRYAEFEFDWLKLRAELASLKAQLSSAEAAYQRHKTLFEREVESQELYDYWKAEYQALQHSYTDKQAVVDSMEKSLKELNPANEDESNYVKAALAVAEEEFRVAEAQLAPITLVAPISGRIRSLSKLNGATVSTGDAIVTISSQKVDHILGFLGQPLRLEPKVGDQVTVRSRGVRRVVGLATITHVGPRVELFDSPLRVRGTGTEQQRGLPVIVSVPGNLKLLPGELVDLTINAKPAGGT